MKRFVEGVDRSQSVLFPERLDDYIGEDIRSGSSMSSWMRWIFAR